MQEIQVSKAILFIQEAILHKRININDPIQFVKEAVNVVATFTNSDSIDEQKQIALKVIEKIAAGADGISGTADDLIPFDVVQKLAAIVNSDLLTSLINFVSHPPPEVASCLACVSKLFKKGAPQ